MMICPRSLSLTLGRSRRNNSPPNSCSSCFIARVSEGCVTLQASAARVKFKWFECQKVTDLMHLHGVIPDLPHSTAVPEIEEVK